MYKKVLVLLIASLVMPTAVSALPVDVLEPPNGNFELWASDDPTNWVYNSAEFWVYEENSLQLVHGDSSSAKLDLISGTSTGSFYNDWQTTEIVAGNSYIFSIWVLDKDLGVLPDGRYGDARLDIDLRSTDNSQSLDSASSSTSVTQDNWQELTCSISSVPSGVGHVIFSLYCTKETDEALIFVDDAFVSGTFLDEFAAAEFTFFGLFFIVALILTVKKKKKSHLRKG